MYQQKSVEELALFAIEICSDFQRDMAGLVKTILNQNMLDSTVCCISDHNHMTLLHCAVLNLGYMFWDNWRRQKPPRHILELTGWIREWPDLLILVSELIKGGWVSAPRSDA